MELVYLWVEKYKNIENQGFNFSPRFDCKYDKDSNELTIDENKDYVSIFPDNINITAIIGENGSGKSSLLFQDVHSNDGFSPDLRVFYNENEILIYEPYKTKFNEDFGPAIELFKIKNNTKTNIKKISISKELDLESEKEQFFSSPIKYIPEPFEVYFSWDILNYTNYDEILYSGEFSSFKNKPNILLDTIKNNNKSIDYYLLFKKIQKLILIHYYDFPFEFFSFKPTHVLLNSYRERHEIKKFKSSIKDEEKFYKEIDENKIELIIDDQLNRTIFNLSNGERNLFFLAIMIFSEVKDNNKHLIYLDEIEQGLHPQWQKILIKLLVKIFSKTNKKIHFIITSHSPFLLSDIPKENIIFLEKGEQKYPFKKGEQTFGANIHNLLSHGFFMQDGLMGEFAKEKINEVIEILKKNELNEDDIKNCKYIISIIGEPILQKTLQSQLDNKLFSNETKLQRLEREQKEIQNRIETLRKQNNETN